MMRIWRQNIMDVLIHNKLYSSQTKGQNNSDDTQSVIKLNNLTVKYLVAYVMSQLIIM